MRSLRVGLMVAGLAPVAWAQPAGEMPANTVVLSAMMRELSSRPGFTEAFLKEIEGGAKKSGAALLTPNLVHHMREMILGKDWQGLDRFPGWTMREINPTVRVVGHVAGKEPAVNGMATAGGAPSGVPGTATTASVQKYIDVGPYGLDKGGMVSLDGPATGEGFVTSEYVSSLGDGVTRGDGPNRELAPLHASSQRIADVLNRLSMNGVDGAAPFEAEFGGEKVSTPEDLLTLLVGGGHSIDVADARYFANFGHLHYNGQDVMMPFWVGSLIVVPGTKRDLLVPVSHAEYEWRIHGPKINAAVSFYFGIDGKAEWRTMDQQDQGWVMSRHAHEYRGASVMEITRLANGIVRTYAHLHQAHPEIPFGGYYAFGVCQDVVAAIEMKMQGKTTLFPNTADDSFFTDPRDAEINGLIKRLPKDRGGKLPEVERIFGSLPVGDSDEELRRVSIPGLAPDLVAVHDAWTAGELKRRQAGWRRLLRMAIVPLGLALGVGLAMWVRRRSRRR